MAAPFEPFEPPDGASPEELRSRLRGLAALIVRAPVPIAIAHDAECQFISANAALARLLGVAEGVNISLTPPAGQRPPYRIQRGGRDIPADELPMQFAISHRTTITNDIEIVRADGTVLYVQNDVEPLYDAHGDVCGCVSVCVDLTERKRIEDILREADRRKDEFLATLSHELRNPLAPIRNAIELMRRVGDEPTLVERARAIMERQVHQLVRLTDDLLDVSRITRNKMELRRDTIDLRLVLDSAIEATQPLIDAAGHRLTVDLPGEPLWVNADFTRLSQVFANLLNNAVKYTDRGGRILLTASTDRGETTVRVSDTGIGIPPSEIPRVFEMFTQLEDSAHRARSGLGIGLTLARSLVELHGGSLAAESAGTGTGTTFSVTVPLQMAAPRPGVGVGDERVRAARRRVLIAEDIPDSAEMLCLMLEYMGHDVRVAADGAQAVELAKEFRPEAVLLDIGMPRMDGYEAGREIRAMLGPGVLMVALTGWGQEEDQQRSREAGFDRHLTKPVEPDVLEKLIAAVAGK